MCNSNPLHLQWVGRRRQTKKGKNIHKRNTIRNVLCSQMRTVCVSSRTGKLCFNHIQVTNICLCFTRVSVALLVVLAVQSNVHGTVHRWICILYNQPEGTYTIFFIIISALHVSGDFFHPSSGAYKTVCAAWVLSWFPAWQYTRLHIQFYKLLMMGVNTARNM